MILFGNFVERVVDRLKARRLIAVWGPRLHGKTAVVKAAAAGIGEEFGETNTLFVGGRDRLRARQELISYKVNHTRRVAIFIDDFDELVSVASEDSFEGVNAVLHALGGLVGAAQAGEATCPHLMIVTTGPPREPLPSKLLGRHHGLFWDRYIDTVSVFAAQFESCQVDAWSTGWRERYRASLCNVLGSLDQVVRKLWVESVLSLTGGHPCLIGPVIDRLRELPQMPTKDRARLSGLQRQMFLRAETPEEAEQQALLVRRSVEDWLEPSGLHEVRSLLRRLSRAESVIEQQAFQHLLVLARTAGFIGDPAVRRVLKERLGLIYTDENSGKDTIPGSMIQSAILGLRERPLSVVPDAVHGERKGAVLVSASEGDRWVSLVGAPWVIAQALIARSGETVRTDELLRALKRPPKDVRIVENAVQRLRWTFEKVGLKDAVEKERGIGYRLIIPPDL